MDIDLNILKRKAGCTHTVRCEERPTGVWFQHITRAPAPDNDEVDEILVGDFEPKGGKGWIDGVIEWLEAQHG